MRGVNKALETSTCCSKSICLKIEIKLGDRKAGVFLERTWTLESICMLMCSVAQLCPALCDPMDYSPPRLLCPQDFPDKHTGMGCHFLLQGIFLTQGLNPGLPHCRQFLYHWATREAWVPGVMARNSSHWCKVQLPSLSGPEGVRPTTEGLERGLKTPGPLLLPKSLQRKELDWRPKLGPHGKKEWGRLRLQTLFKCSPHQCCLGGLMPAVEWMGEESIGEWKNMRKFIIKTPDHHLESPRMHTKKNKIWFLLSRG